MTIVPIPLRRTGLIGIAAVVGLAGLRALPEAQAKSKRTAAATRKAKKPSAPRTAAAPFRFDPETLELGPGEEDLVEIRLGNPYGHATVGTLKLNPGAGISLNPDGWNGPLPPWGAKFYTHVRAAPSAPLGDDPIPLTYFVDRAGQYHADLPVRIKKPIEVEMVPDYVGSAVRVRVHNLLEHRTERGRVGLKSPDRFLQDQVSAVLPPIPPGETREVAIPVIKGGIAPGEAYRFDATVETWAGYKTQLSQHLVFYQAPR